jgi:hypothetical protein
MTNSQQILGQLTTLYGSANWNSYSFYRWCYYDYVRVPFTAVTPVTKLNFFVNPMGSPDPVSGLAKTEEETNLKQQRSFGDNFFVITQIRTDISLLPKARQALDIANDGAAFTEYPYFNRIWETPVLYKGVLNIAIGGKTYQIINQPFMSCPPGFGYKYLNIPSITTSFLNINESMRKQKSKGSGVYNLEPVQLIEPQRNLNISMEFVDGGLPSTFLSWVDYPTSGQKTPRINIGLILEGFIARPNS